VNILTFDIEEWFIYEQYPKGGKGYYLPILNSLLERLLDILDRESVKATFFCLGIIAREYPEVLCRIASRGHEIGCHSDRHISALALGPDGFENDLKLALESIENVINQKVTAFRAPAFSVSDKTNWAFEILAKNGIKNDCSVFPTKRTGGGYLNFKSSHPVLLKTTMGPVMEFPVNMCKVLGKKVPFSGGGYFRLLPYSAIKSMMNSSDYVMSYFHLRDFDAKQRVVISPRYFKSYYGIKNMLPKLERFLGEYRFLAVSEASKALSGSQIAEIIIE